MANPISDAITNPLDLGRAGLYDRKKEGMGFDCDGGWLGFGCPKGETGSGDVLDTSETIRLDASL